MTVFHTARITLAKADVVRAPHCFRCFTFNFELACLDFFAESFSEARRKVVAFVCLNMKVFDICRGGVTVRLWYCVWMRALKIALGKRSWKVKRRLKPHGEFIHWCNVWGKTGSAECFLNICWLNNVWIYWSNALAYQHWWSSAGLLISSLTLVKWQKKKSPNKILNITNNVSTPRWILLLSYYE